ncbi:hypothetical protein HD554DRAFT_1669118 [Boletus coccyginus]|nr:hypothetical protein HD554DRAFT_1669118 [Boletus coccyginus]
MTNVWAPSPSPSLVALSSESPSSSALLVDRCIASTLPTRLWDVYVTYLWHYQPNSWVGRVVSTFRILAVVLVFPVVLLTLLDVTSYVIARTLGVVDDAKASTSDADTAADGPHISVAAVSARVPTTCTCACAPFPLAPVRASEGSVKRRTDGDGHDCMSETGVGTSAAGHACGAQPRGSSRLKIHAHVRSADRDALDAPPRAYYFAGEEEDLRLAGEGVFSPAVSVPPSPLTPGILLDTFTEGGGRVSGQVSEEEGIVLRRRVRDSREDEVGHP